MNPILTNGGRPATEAQMLSALLGAKNRAELAFMDAQSDLDAFLIARGFLMRKQSTVQNLPPIKRNELPDRAQEWLERIEGAAPAKEISFGL